MLRGAALLIGLPLAACVQAGDLGRPKRSPLYESAAGATGTAAAVLRGEQVSGFILTDDEQELRDRARRFLMPAHERAWFETMLAELARTRILPLDARPADPRAYHEALMSEARRSPLSAYRRIAEDALADGRLVRPFAKVAARVLAADGVRVRSLSYVAELGRGEVADAAARVAENACLIAWVGHQTGARARSYRYALEHLLIEAPQGEAARVERALAVLAQDRDALGPVLAVLPPEPACWGALTAFVVEEVVAPAPRPGIVSK